MNPVIVSPNNKLIKEVASLKHKKYRDELGLFVAEGVRLVEECAASAWPVHVCIYTEAAAARDRARRVLDRLAAARCRLVAVPETVYNKLSDTEQPQGIMAVLKKQQASLAQMTAPGGKVPLLVVLDGIQDPGNAGTIIRTADAAGCTGVITLKGATDIYAGKTVRAAMGSLFHLPVWEGAAAGELITALKAANIGILATALEKAATYYQADLKQPVAVILGNEGQGVSRELIDKADGCLTIPLVGEAESLNVAVAAGVILYEAVRQRATL